MTTTCRSKPSVRAVVVLCIPVVATATSEGFWTCRLLPGQGQPPGMHHARADVELVYVSGLRDDVPPMEQRSRSSSPREDHRTGPASTRNKVGSQKRELR
jgi:hypothetical protein